MGRYFDDYGPVAIVTGAAQGLGACFTRELVRRGFEVVAVDCNAEKLDELCADLEGRAHPLVLDLARADHAQALDDATADRDVGLVIHNAAWAPLGPLAETSLDALQHSLDVNVRAPLFVARTFLPRLKARKRSGMIFLSSLSVIVGAPGFAAYAASRAYTRSLGETLWNELAPDGIDVLVAMPGATATEGFWASDPRRDGVRKATVGIADPEPVALEALDALGHGPVRVLGRTNRLTEYFVGRLLPRSMANRIVSSSLRAMYGHTRGGNQPPAKSS